VEGWWNGRSRNWKTNLIFRQTHTLCHSEGITLHTRYVTSAENPADPPSRGIEGPQDQLLPKVGIPTGLEPFIIDYDEPLTTTEHRLLRRATHVHPASTPKPHSTKQ
jgi:hypothetical protein